MKAWEMEQLLRKKGVITNFTEEELREAEESENDDFEEEEEE